ncbi:hypothetical protein G4B88_001344 [Cannabis sativa]|uniref:C2H2-type domain-containing protein n=1 Tax=Cannabis sativa TaxID=3483 RepID=A0A7J6I118_CANSA|nr:hypothetical protein G4B88_001344 [Cannabis sativa]
MNEEEKQRFEFYFPTYYASCRNFANYSTTNDTNNFNGAFQLSEREKLQAQVNLLTRKLDVLKAKYEDTYEVYDEPYFDYEVVDNKNGNHNWKNIIDCSWKSEYNYNAPIDLDFAEKAYTFCHSSQFTNSKSLEENSSTFSSSLENERKMNENQSALLTQLVEENMEFNEQISNNVLPPQIEIIPSPSTPISCKLDGDDAITIWSDNISHPEILPTLPNVIPNENKYYHTDVIDTVVEEICKIFSSNQTYHFLHDFENKYFLYPENVTNASILETKDNRKEFGDKVVPPNRILKILRELFDDHEDQSVLASSKKLTIELCRWIGEGSKNELEAELVNITNTKPTPSRKIRFEQGKEKSQKTSLFRMSEDELDIVLQESMLLYENLVIRENEEQVNEEESTFEDVEREAEAQNIELYPCPICQGRFTSLEIVSKHRTVHKHFKRRRILIGWNWAGLPSHLLDIVFQNLYTLKDCLAFSNTCCSWHSIAKDNKNRVVKLSEHQVPLLLVPNTESDNKDEWCVYDVLNNKFLSSKPILPPNICGSSQGWLLSQDENFNLTLYKPFAQRQNKKENNNHNNTTVIELPPLFETTADSGLSDFFPREYLIRKMAICTPDQSNPQNFKVSVICGTQSDCCSTINITSCKVSKDSLWTGFEIPHSKVPTKFKLNDIMFYKNNLKLQPYEELEIDGKPFSYSKYLVESFTGDYLIVKRFRKVEAFHLTRYFMVFKLRSDDQKFEKMTNLGDNTCISVQASHFPGCQKNCIYFTHDKDPRENYNGPYDLGVYNMETRKCTKIINFDFDAIIKMDRRRPIWILPTLFI